MVSNLERCLLIPLVLSVLTILSLIIFSFNYNTSLQSLITMPKLMINNVQSDDNKTSQSNTEFLFSSLRSHHNHKSFATTLSTKSLANVILTQDSDMFEDQLLSSAKMTKKSLPNLVIHVGPPKTATSSIQVILSEWNASNMLWEKSRYIYLGKIPGFYLSKISVVRYEVFAKAKEDRRHKPKKRYSSTTLSAHLRNISCYNEMSAIREAYHKKISRTKVEENNITNFVINQSWLTLRESLLQIPCANEMYKKLQQYSEKRTNLLVSDEMMSRGYRFWTSSQDTDNEYSRKYYTDCYNRSVKSTDNETEPAKELTLLVGSFLDWVSLAVLLKPIYNITVIVGYRRYMDWLPSMKQSLELYSGLRKHWKLWPNRNQELLESDDDKNITENSSSCFKSLNKDSVGGIVMEPLFPNYWKRVVPGQIVPSGNFRGNDWTEEFWSNVLDIPSHYTDTTVQSIQHQRQQLANILEKDSNNTDDDNKVDIKNDNHNSSRNSSDYDEVTEGDPLNLNVVVYNLHELTSINYYHTPLISLNFVCNALPDASKLCSSIQLQYEKSMRRSVSTSSSATDIDNKIDINNTMSVYEKVLNPSSSYTIYDQLVTAAYLKGLFNVNREGNNTNSSTINQHSNYTMQFRVKNKLITGTRRAKIYKKTRSLSRHFVVCHAFRYHFLLLEAGEGADHENAFNTSDLEILKFGRTLPTLDPIPLLKLLSYSSSEYKIPLDCPSRKELELFLQKSLQYELKILPDFYHNLTAGKTRHVQDFWRNANEKKKYCSINTTAALEQNHWIYFFSRYPQGN